MVEPIVKPLLRGHFHQAAFFFTLGACAMLITQARGIEATIAMIVYTVGVSSSFGISALYHRPNWNERARALMRRLDHAAIFFMIASTGTPIAMLAIWQNGGDHFLTIIWVAAVVGILQTLFWIGAPRFLAAILYVAMGWLAYPYMGEIKTAMGASSIYLLLSGGVIYTVGAVIYAMKRPNPLPKVFGYHEIFHLLTIVAATLHFIVIAKLLH